MMFLLLVRNEQKFHCFCHAVFVKTTFYLLNRHFQNETLVHWTRVCVAAFDLILTLFANLVHSAKQMFNRCHLTIRA